MYTAPVSFPMDSAQVGDELPHLDLPPITRATLALFAGASGDHNPIHIDIDVARRAGLPDVFAHGMLEMAWLARLLTLYASQNAIRRFDVRFVGVAQVGHAIRCTGRVVGKTTHAGEQCLRVELTGANQHGQKLLTGEALLAVFDDTRESV